MSAGAAPDLSAFDSAIRGRLAALIEQHSQAGVARKGGTSRSNISRYMSGTKIPAEFCANLAVKLDLNPAWLLTGEGMPYASDVSEATAGTAAELLELVESMKAVMALPLEMLSAGGNPHAARHLDQTLEEYERLRHLTNTRTSPALYHVLSEFRGAILRRDDNRAPILRDSAHLIARLCDDVFLHTYLTSCEAMRELETEGGIACAIDLYRHLLLDTLAAYSESPWIRIGGPANEYVRLLLASGRYEEARRVVAGLLRLAGPEHSDLGAYASLRSYKAIADFELGDGRKAWSELSRLRLETSAEGIQDSINSFSLYLDLAFGAVDPLGALALAGHRMAGASAILPRSLWAEHPGVAEAVLRACEEECHGGSYRQWGARVNVHLVTMLSMALNGNESAADEWPIPARGSSGAKPDPFTDFLAGVSRAQRARILGNHSLALDLTRAMDELYLHHCHDVQHDLVMRAIHYRNALELVPSDAGRVTAKSGRKKRAVQAASVAAMPPAGNDAGMRQRAMHFFTDHFARGYGMFEDIVRQHNLDGGQIL